MFVPRLVFVGVLGLVIFAGAEALRAHATAAQARPESIAGTIGVVSLDPNGKNSKIRFFNRDGSVWYEYTFEGDKGVPQATRNSFKPFAFHADYYLLALKCVRRDAKYFEVIVDEDRSLTKLVRISDRNMRFQTWQEHLLTLFAVDFDRSANPVRRSPAGRAYDRPMPKHLVFSPVQIQGNWMKIRWTAQNTRKRRSEAGWIRWRDRNHLLIEPFYIS